MIKITINGKSFRGIYSWDDISLQRFCDLSAIPMPEGYEAYILADGKFDYKDQKSMDNYSEVVLALTDNQLNKEFPAYYRKVIACLSEVPMSVLDPMPKEFIEEKFNSYFKPFVLSLIYHFPVINYMARVVEYTPERIKSFRIGLDKFYLPKTVSIMGNDITLAEEPVISFVEASDIFKGMRLSRSDVMNLAEFMSIYCRGKNEEYDLKKALMRKDIMMKAPMSVVWAVFFYTIRRLPDCTLSTLLFGGLPKPLTAIVSEARTYRNLVTTE